MIMVVRESCNPQRPTGINRNLLFCVLILCLGLIGCNGSEDAAGAYETQDAQQIELPEAAPAEAFLLDLSEASLSKAYRPKVAVDPEDTVVAVYNVNLDLEASEEQILLLSRENPRNAPLKIAVISYDMVVEGYSIAFETEIASTNPRSTELQFTDVVGDHGIEIVCKGLDAEGRQTLDVYRKSTSPTGFGLFFDSIFSLAIEGTLEIVPVERSESYKDGFTNGASFQIKTLATPRDAENLLDLVETVYYWRFTDRRYVVAETTRISGAKVEQDQLKELYNGGPEVFEAWLAGGWILTTGSTAGPAYFFFEPDDRTYTYYSGDIQESYRWNQTYKILVNRIALSGVNDLVPYIRTNLYIQVDRLDSIRLLGTESWIGTYQRVSASALSTDGSEEPQSETRVELSGLYKSDFATEITFYGKHFVHTDTVAVSNGVFSMYRTDVPIIELKFRDTAGIVRKSVRYKYSYSEEVRDGRIFRSLYLQEGVIGIYGFEATEDGFTRFEQIEEVE